MPKNNQDNEFTDLGVEHEAELQLIKEHLTRAPDNNVEKFKKEHLNMVHEEN